MHQWAFITALFAIASTHGSLAAAQGYPAKPVRVVVPSAPGAGPDVQAHALAEQLSRAWSSQVLVDNRPSPAANVAAEVVAKAPPDGYTLLLTTSALAINASLNAKLPFNPSKEFVAVGSLTLAPFVLLVHPSLPVKSVKELVALAKAQPEKLNYGHSRNGSADHLCGELFGKAAGIRVLGAPNQEAPQSGGPPFNLEGHYLFADVAAAMPYVKAGKARAIAVTSMKRSTLLPNVPTVHDTLPGFECGGWQALFASARTPPDVLKRIEAAVSQAMQSKELGERLAAQGLQPVPASTETLRAFLPQEIARLSKLVRETNIKLE